MAWLAGWNYRKKLTLQGTAAGPHNNYQLPVTVHYADTKDSAIHDDTDYYSINYPFQRHIFYMHGLLWIFYADIAGNHIICYKTSPDGVNWSAQTNVVTAGGGAHGWSIYYDGTYIHYARDNQTNGQPLYYRRGTPNANGTITWSAERTVATPAGTDSFWYPTIIVDSTGHAWIGTMLNHSVGPTYDAVVYKNANTDDTWATDGGFPYTLASGVTDHYTVVMGATQTGGKTYWVYTKANYPTLFYGRPWNGAAWGAEEAVTTTNRSVNVGSLIADGDNMHFAYGSVYYSYYSGGAWGAEYQVTATGAPSGHVATTLTAANSVIVTWIDTTSKHIFYREKRAGTWQTEVDWLDESAEGFKNYIELNAIPDSSGPIKLFIAYQTNTVANYHLKASVVWQDMDAHVANHGHGNADFSDIRFTQSDGTSLLPYWIESSVVGDRAYIWVQYNTIPVAPGTADFYIYYGNPGVGDASDGDATFIFHDHFPGAALDGAKWTLENAPTVVVAGSIVTLTSAADALRGIHSNASYGPNNLRWRSRTAAPGANFGQRHALSDRLEGNNGDMAVIARGAGATGYVRTARLAVVTTTDSAGFDPTNYHVLEQRWIAGEVKFFQDDILKQTHITNIPAAALFLYEDIYFALGSSNTIDWVALANYIPPEPTWGAWGNEELPGRGSVNMAAKLISERVI